MAIHLLGNGPSIRRFTRDEWPDSEHIFVGCNFSDINLRPHYTMIIDVRAIKQFMRDDPYVLKIDAIVSTRAYNYLDDRFGWNKVSKDTINVIDTIELIRDRKISKNLAMNSGQHGVVYAMKRETNHKTVHIWGTDSFWMNDLESITDSVVRPNQKSRRIRPRITAQWNKYWFKIFREYQSHNFIIHVPMNVHGLSDLTNYDNVNISWEDV